MVKETQHLLNILFVSFRRSSSGITSSSGQKVLSSSGQICLKLDQNLFERLKFV